MNVTAVMVMSADGRITDPEGEVYSWSSREDQEQFFDLVGRSELVVMGSSTYQKARPYIRLKPETLRVVLTKNPESYKWEEVTGQLEFRNQSPRLLIEELKAGGYTQMLLVGGSRLLASFLSESLVDILLVTVEPVVFGKGMNLVHWEEKSSTSLTARFPCFLELMRVTQLNEIGTMQLSYRCKKNEQARTQ